jgi:hypothetical protein
MLNGSVELARLLSGETCGEEHPARAVPEVDDAP